MEKLSKIWEWFNGRKMKIGAYSLAVIQIAVLLGAPIPASIVMALDIFFSVFFLGGAGHKAIKEIEKNGGVKSTIDKYKFKNK